MVLIPSIKKPIKIAVIELGALNVLSQGVTHNKFAAILKTIFSIRFINWTRNLNQSANGVWEYFCLDDRIYEEFALIECGIFSIGPLNVVYLLVSHHCTFLIVSIFSSDEKIIIMLKYSVLSIDCWKYANLSWSKFQK